MPCKWDVGAKKRPVIWKHAGRDATTTYSSIHAPSLIFNELDRSKLKGVVDKRTITSEWQRPPPTATTELQLHEKPPLDTIINAQDFEDIAQRTITKKTWAFYSSASTDCITRDANKAFFSQIWFRPRLLRSVGQISTRSTMLGHETDLSIFVSPAAMAKMIHAEGEKDIARACASARIPQCVSTNASFPIAEIAACLPPETQPPPFFFQLYVNKDRAQSAKLLQHVRSLGIDTVFLTIDGPVQGKREADERVKADESLRTPMSGQAARNDRRGGGLGRIMGSYIDPDFNWEDFSWVRQHWEGKIVVKGVQSWQDAKRCADEGMDGVLLSNHGGRNLDSSPPVIMTLLECQRNCPEIFSKLEVFVDGGVRRGADVLKCLCLGATAVGFGRPFLYALNYGEEGVRHFIDIIQQELEVAMALVGITDLSQCDASYVNTAELDALAARGDAHPYATGKRLGGRAAVPKARL